MKFGHLHHVRNASGAPRPIDLKALVALDPNQWIRQCDALILTAQKAGERLPDGEQETLNEQLEVASRGLDEASRASEAMHRTATNSQNSRKVSTKTVDAVADGVHAALVAIGDASLILQLAGAVVATATNMSPAGIYAARRRQLIE